MRKRRGGFMRKGAGQLLDKAGFVELMIAQQVLQFGEFTLKSGRSSPYFFNLGNISDAAGTAALGAAYANKIAELGWEFDVIFGPAYKGIPIAVATGYALSATTQQSSKVPTNPGISYNRKEAKTHGEGGVLVGANIQDQRVLIVDDVLTAGTAVREAMGAIEFAGGRVAGVLVALDRCELLGTGSQKNLTAVEHLGEVLQVPIASIVQLEDVIAYLDRKPVHLDAVTRVRAYRDAYCRGE